MKGKNPRTKTTVPAPGAPVVHPKAPAGTTGGAKPRRAPAPRESAIKRAVRQALGAHPDLHVLWLHVGGAIVTRVRCPGAGCGHEFNAHDQAVGQRLDAGLGTGTGDLIGLTAGGRMLQIEIKRPGEVERPGQPERRRLINGLGGYACVVTSVDEAIYHATSARQGLPARARPLDLIHRCAPSSGHENEVRARYWRHAHDVLAAERDASVDAAAAGKARDTARATLAAMGLEP